MQHKRTTSEQESQPKPKQYCKQSCQLTEFPTIKLHVLQYVQVLNISNNFISDLNSLKIHSNSSQFALSRLRVVNISGNQLSNSQSLQPLASTGKHIVDLNIQNNPLTLNLNYLFEIVLIFQQVRQVHYGSTLFVQSDTRDTVVKHQLNGGLYLASFIDQISHKTEMNHSQCSEQINIIQNIIGQLELEQTSIMTKNSLIFNCIAEFMKLCLPEKTSRQNTFRSPQLSRRSPHQIQAISEYQISKSPNNLMRYLTEAEQPDRPVNLINFYYKEMTTSEAIHKKILQQIELDEEEVTKIEKGDFSGFNYLQLKEQIANKWNNNAKLTNKYMPKTVSHHASNNQLTPFKSIQTYNTSRRETTQFIQSRIAQQENYYFALDSQWTDQTHCFVQHRLLSLLKKYCSSINHVTVFPSSTNRQNQVEFNDNTSAFNYQTFGQYLSPNLQLQLNNQESNSSDVDSLEQVQIMSPKSRNKFIISSCVKNLEQVIKHIVFRRICAAKIVKPEDVLQLCDTLLKITKRLKQIGIRKIYQQSLFQEVIQKKMELFKKYNIFKAWKKIRSRKMKLIKMIINRKNKKQKAFLSVFITQWRITSRNIKFQQILKMKQKELAGQKQYFGDISCILRRSVTKKIIPTSSNCDRNKAKTSIFGLRSTTKLK